MSIVNTFSLQSNRKIKINFDGGDLSSDAGLLLIKEFISKLGIERLLNRTFKTNDPVFKAVLVRSRTQGRLHSKGDVPCPVSERIRLLPLAEKQEKAEQASASCGQDRRDSCGASG